jgi:hypothetical protein
MFSNLLKHQKRRQERKNVNFNPRAVAPAAIRETEKTATTRILLSLAMAVASYVAARDLGGVDSSMRIMDMAIPCGKDQGHHEEAPD